MNRRSFIRGLAAALPAGTVAAQVAAETDPIRAAYITLCAALDAEAKSRCAAGWSTFAIRKIGDPILNVHFYMPDGVLQERQVEGFRQVPASA
jgi:hypothetical protein